MTDAVDRHLPSPEEREWWHDTFVTTEVLEAKAHRDPLLWVLLAVGLSNFIGLMYLASR